MNNKTFFKTLLVCLAMAVSFTNTHAQSKKKAPAKYNSLLWEITGKGLKGPSYLFGTMHVSDKLAFNLSDSFYMAIKRVDVVALEQDPGSWQDYYTKNGFGNQNAYAAYMAMFGSFMSSGNLYKNMFSIDPYEQKIRLGLLAQPTIVNALLYRSNTYNQDYEEDTYLDLYLYQMGKKLNKLVDGLENPDSSDQIQKDAEKALAEDRKKPHFNDNYDPDAAASPYTLQEAYKKGDLDLLDSMDIKMTASKRYRALFIEKRNQIQAASIDTIIKKGNTVFAGVGASHLPGKNGVIEELRKMGYTLRAVKMESRNSLEKEKMQKIRYPVNFTTQYTSDSLIKADIPGKWYRFGTSNDLIQHADMANGTYYTLTRVPTYASFWGQNESVVLRKVDSLLYENIPGKITKKTAVERNGYKGYDITNRTRHGEMQRYLVLVLPFEVAIAKMSGTGEYVTSGLEADRFFNSIAIGNPEKTGKTNYSPVWGGFSAILPQKPAIYNKSGSLTAVPCAYLSADAATGNQYLFYKETLQRTSEIEEDSFELNLLNESYMSSKMVDTMLSKKFISQGGYPGLEATYKLDEEQSGGYSMVRYVIQGPHYYALVAHGKKPFTQTPEPLASFAIKPFIYPNAKPQTDTVFGYTFQSPVDLPKPKNGKDIFSMFDAIGGDNAESMKDMMRRIAMASLQQDSTGEKVTIAGVKYPSYTYFKDSTQLFASNQFSEETDDSTLIKRSKKRYTQNGWSVTETAYSDTNSSRMLKNKSFYRNGVTLAVSAYLDTLSPKSPFIETVFNTIAPADSIVGNNPFTPKSGLFFTEYKSKDSATYKRAISNLANVKFTKADVPQLKQSFESLAWGQPYYLGLKKRFIAALGTVQEDDATNLLKQLYNNSKDTAIYQQDILDALLNQRTRLSFKTFAELITNDPPVEVSSTLSNEEDGIKDAANMFGKTGAAPLSSSYDYENSSSWSQLADTMQLTKEIMPTLLGIMNLDDYEERMESLLTDMTDSGYVSMDLVQPYYAKFLIEGKQELKKAQADESASSIKQKAAQLQKKSQPKIEEEDISEVTVDTEDKDFLDLYNKLVLLSPFYDKQNAVKDLYNKSMTLNAKSFRFDLMRLMMRKKINAVPDTLINFFAADDEYRGYMYNYLNKHDKLDLMPARYKTMEMLGQNRMKNFTSKSDTFALVSKLPFEYKQQKGIMLFYKYKKNSAAKWDYAITGILYNRTDSTKFDYSDYEFYSVTKEKLDESKPLQEELDRILKETLYSKHKCAASFYKKTNDYSDYLGGLGGD